MTTWKNINITFDLVGAIVFLLASTWFVFHGDYDRATYCLAFTILCRVDMAIDKLKELK